MAIEPFEVLNDKKEQKQMNEFNAKHNQITGNYN